MSFQRQVCSLKEEEEEVLPTHNSKKLTNQTNGQIVFAEIK